jgi:hypothetical protein
MCPSAVGSIRPSGTNFTIGASSDRGIARAMAGITV